VPKVLIDLRMVRGRLHGIARYALELAKRLPALAPSWSFAGLVGPDPLPELGPLTPELPLERCPARFLSPLEQPALAASLVRSRCDLFHATSFSVPALWPGPLVATLHDANHLALRDLYGPGRVAYYKLVVGPRAKAARALITVSESAREQLSAHLGLSPYRLQVIAPGVDPRFFTATSELVTRVRSMLQLPPEFYLAVGNDKPFKNLELLVRIARELPLPLVLLAGRGVCRKFAFPASTVELGDVPEDELPALYSSAEALLFPSRYEGFGLPALEAMAAGTPVIAARATSLPELVGEAGVLVEPDDRAGWIEAARALRSNPTRRAELMQRGRERAARYTWDDCARRTLTVYARALGVEVPAR
jgi:glycosyltransferase involved in cell wall biosynthesis